jgi:dTDP-4-dehydrorhamnose 3,5-epimerase
MSGRLAWTPTRLMGVQEVVRTPLRDSRGSLTRLFCAEELLSAGWEVGIAQINHTHTARKGTIRGMHLQHAPYDEFKLVTCIRGAVHDVAVDLRAGSPSLLAHHATTLSAENGRGLLIPPGCAHGFQSLCNDAELIYLHSAPYVPEAESGVSALDPLLSIRWQLPVSIISDRDASYSNITAEFEGFAV